MSVGTLWYSIVTCTGLDRGATAFDTARRLDGTDVGGPCQLPSLGQVGGPHYPHRGDITNRSTVFLCLYFSTTNSFLTFESR
jgi:hypothetical protein